MIFNSALAEFFFDAGKAEKRKEDFPAIWLTIFFLIPASPFHGINCCHARFKVLLSITLSFLTESSLHVPALLPNLRL
jgi:hypothetical protein